MPVLSRLGIEEVVRAATLAPSVLNIQPWRFVGWDDLIELHLDTERTLPVTDPRRRALTISCGAALLNLELAVAALGHRPEVQLLPQGEASSVLATVGAGRAGPPTAGEQRLHAAIPERRSSRVPYVDQPLAPEEVADLEAAALHEGATLALLASTQAEEAAHLVRLADEHYRTDAGARAEIVHWTRRPASAGDGIPDRALGPSPLHRGSVAVRDFAPGEDVPRRQVAHFEHDPALALLLTEHDDTVSWLRAGRALERVWLQATDTGLAMSLLTQPLEQTHLRWLARPAGPHGADRPWPQVLMRLGRGRTALAARTPRRPLLEVLTFATDPTAGREQR